MKTSLKILSLFSAASVPAVLAAEQAGLQLPAMLDATHAFSAFVVGSVVLIAFADYSRVRTARAPRITNSMCTVSACSTNRTPRRPVVKAIRPLAV